MKDADKYISVLQKRFPNVTVKWSPPPNSVWENNFCAIHFISKSDPNKILEVPFDNGLGYNDVNFDINALIVVNEHKIYNL